MYRLILTNANNTMHIGTCSPRKKSVATLPTTPFFLPYRSANGMTSYRNPSKKGVVGSSDFCKSISASCTDLSSINKNSGSDFFRGELVYDPSRRYRSGAGYFFWKGDYRWLL